MLHFPKKSFLEYSRSKRIAREELRQKVEELRKEKKSIVTINGSFDLLHAGHLHMLYEASLQGDLLLVALNTDNSIKQYKSSKRPIIALEERMQMMTALSFVDYVTSFEETDPCALLSVIQPDVHVNGSEYGLECIEAKTVREGGGRLHIVELIPGLSTSQIVKKIICSFQLNGTHSDQSQLGAIELEGV